jgi:hypothetical protein
MWQEDDSEHSLQCIEELACGIAEPQLFGCHTLSLDPIVSSATQMLEDKWEGIVSMTPCTNPWQRTVKSVFKGGRLQELEIIV